MDKSAFVGVLGSREEVVKPQWNPRLRQAILRRKAQVADSLMVVLAVDPETALPTMDLAACLFGFCSVTSTTHKGT